MLENGTALFRLLITTLCLFVSAHICFASPIRGVPRVVDADTVYIGSTKIRFSGIDAPETEQICLDSAGKNWNCGIDAKQRLEEFSHGREWTCELSGQDVYGRSLGVCTVAGENVSRWLVRHGWALAFRRYSSEYVSDEDYAHEQKAGVWSGAFIAPWDWRHRNSSTMILGAIAVPSNAQRVLVKSPPSSPPTSQCLIKANLSSAPQCIYHVPGGRFYERLSMQPPSKRRWFCTEAEAEAAGCRKSKL
jgi:endonuclease YncB( thermonuclease family)